MKPLQSSNPAERLGLRREKLGLKRSRDAKISRLCEAVLSSITNAEAYKHFTELRKTGYRGYVHVRLNRSR